MNGQLARLPNWVFSHCETMLMGFRSRGVVFGADAVSDITSYCKGWGDGEEGGGITCYGEYEDGG